MSEAEFNGNNDKLNTGRETAVQFLQRGKPAHLQSPLPTSQPTTTDIKTIRRRSQLLAGTCRSAAVESCQRHERRKMSIGPVHVHPCITAKLIQVRAEHHNSIVNPHELLRKKLSLLAIKDKEQENGVLGTKSPSTTTTSPTNTLRLVSPRRSRGMGSNGGNRLSASHRHSRLVVRKCKRGTRALDSKNPLGFLAQKLFVVGVDDLLGDTTAESLSLSLVIASSQKKEKDEECVEEKKEIIQPELSILLEKSCEISTTGGQPLRKSRSASFIRTNLEFIDAINPVEQNTTSLNNLGVNHTNRSILTRSQSLRQLPKETSFSLGKEGNGIKGNGSSGSTIMGLRRWFSINRYHKRNKSTGSDNTNSHKSTLSKMRSLKLFRSKLRSCKVVPQDDDVSTRRRESSIIHHNSAKRGQGELIKLFKHFFENLAANKKESTTSTNNQERGLNSLRQHPVNDITLRGLSSSEILSVNNITDEVSGIQEDNNKTIVTEEQEEVTMTTTEEVSNDYVIINDIIDVLRDNNDHTVDLDNISDFDCTSIVSPVPNLEIPREISIYDDRSFVATRSHTNDLRITSSILNKDSFNNYLAESSENGLDGSKFGIIIDKDQQREDSLYYSIDSMRFKQRSTLTVPQEQIDLQQPLPKIGEGSLVYHGSLQMILENMELKLCYLHLTKDFLVISETVVEKLPDNKKSQYLITDIIHIKDIDQVIGRSASDHLDNIQEPVGVNSQSTARYYPPVILSTIRRFEIEPSTAIKFLIGRGGIKPDATAIVRFLHSTPELDRRMLGRLLSVEANQALLNGFLAKIPWQGCQLDWSLRVLFSAVRLTSHDLNNIILKKFAQHWCEANAGCLELSTVLSVISALLGWNNSLSLEEFIRIDPLMTKDLETQLSWANMYNEAQLTHIPECKDGPKIAVSIGGHLASRFIQGEPSASIWIRLPSPDPDLKFILHGPNVLCQPSMLDFSHSALQSFKITGLQPGKAQVLFIPIGQNSTRYEYISPKSFSVEPHFMMHTLSLHITTPATTPEPPIIFTLISRTDLVDFHRSLRSVMSSSTSPLPLSLPPLPASSSSSQSVDQLQQPISSTFHQIESRLHSLLDRPITLDELVSTLTYPNP